MRHFLALTLAASCVWGLMCARAAGADEAVGRVVEVRVEGNRQMSATAVLAHVRTRAGAAYDQSVVQADEQRLLNTGRFDSVRATRTETAEGVIVTFVVGERPLVAGVTFEGNEKLKTKDLAGELTFGEGDAFSPFNIEAGRQAILQKYRSSGYSTATVEVDEETLQENRVVYRIHEGPQVRVRSIEFRGREHFSKWRLRQAIETRSRLWPVVAGWLDAEKVQRDEQALRNLYADEGFLDAQVRTDVELYDGAKKARVIFSIEEGQRFRVNEVIFQGNTVFGDEELARRLRLSRGEFFTSEAFHGDANRIRQTYGELGYINAEVEPARRFLPPDAAAPAWAAELDEGRPALLNVIFHIIERDQYRIGQVIIRGNSVTRDRVIRRELRFFPEQLYNTVAVEESEHRLQETRLFEAVDITPVGGDGDVRDVLVRIEEGRTANFIIGVGVSTNSGLLGNVALVERNFDITRWPTGWDDITSRKAWRGGGQTFQIVAEPGLDLMRYSVEWFEPKLFDRPYALGTKVFYFDRQHDDYTESRLGNVTSLGHRFKNRWYGELAGRVEGVELDPDFAVAPEIDADAGSSVLVGLEGTLVRDRTDSRWLPSRGDRLRISYEQVGGSYSFGRAVGEYTAYRTLRVDALDRKHILAGRVSTGHIFGDAPVFEKFYGGGLGSLRGFEYRGISPRSAGQIKNGSLVGVGDAIGGDFMFFAGTEYTFPIMGEQLRGVIFLDSGTVEEDFEITSYRVSTGFGIQWTVSLFGPVPMSLYFGFPLAKDSQDDTQLISFTFGWTF